MMRSVPVLMLLTALGLSAMPSQAHAQSTSQVSPQATPPNNQKMFDTKGLKLDYDASAFRPQAATGIPATPRARLRQTPTITPEPLGRVRLENGSFGFDSETRMKANEFPDGQRTLNIEPTKRQAPSYLGLSLTVPNETKQFPLPVPQAGPPPLFNRTPD